MDPQILVQLTKTISEQNQSPILIEENWVQNNFPKDKTRSYIIKLGSEGYLAIDKPINYQSSEAYQKKFWDELHQMQQQKELFHQICEMKNPLIVPRSEISENTINKIRGGGTIREAAWLLITIWMLHQQSVGFHPVTPVVRPPHVEEAHNLLFGKPKTDELSCRRLSMFDSQQSENKNTNTNISKKSPRYSETVKFNDGYEAEAINLQLDHILVKHGHQWGVDDIDLKTTEDANNHLSPGKPEQLRTRLTPQNREKLRIGIQNMASNSNLELYPSYPISGGMGRAYLCPDTGLFIGIDENNIIRKAYVAGENLINYLRINCT